MGIAMRVIGGLLSGTGDALLAEAKKKREDFLVAMQRADKIEDRNATFGQQSALTDKQIDAETQRDQGRITAESGQIAGVATEPDGNIVGYTKGGERKDLGIKSSKPTDPIKQMFQDSEGNWLGITEAGKTIDTGHKGRLPENAADRPQIVKPGDKAIDKTGKVIYGGEGNNTPGAGEIHGEDFLKSLPTGDAAQIKALADGRMAFPTGAALRSEYWQQRLDQVAQYDEAFDTINYNSRSKTRADITSGPSSKNIKSINTAIGHLGTLDSQIGGTSSTSFPYANAVGNYISRQTGDAGITNFEQTASALATELTAVFRGTGGAEADVKRYLEQLNANASESQKRAAVKNITDLLNSRIEAIGDMYNKGMGKSSDPLELLDPKASGVLRRLRGDDAAQATGAKPAGTTGAAPPPASAGPSAQQQGDPLSQARDAIAKGANRDAVINRLRSNGIDPGGL